MHKDVAFPNSPHGQFLLVAGPSGGGKSTFIRALTEGRLDASILAALPEGCARWRVVEANDILKNRIKAAPSMDSASTDAAIYHYDIAFIHRFAISAYEQDPFCSTLKDAPLLDIIYVRPDLTSLLKQYRLRRQNNRAARSWLRRFWHYSVRQPLKRIKLRKNGLPAIDADDLYCLPGFSEFLLSRLGTFSRRRGECQPAIETSCRAATDGSERQSDVRHRSPKTIVTMFVDHPAIFQ